MISQSIKPIETFYKGYRFRSRLEARWAVFFDAMGILWEYEKEGYAVREVMYLPDFYFPDLKMWAEVKGTDFNLMDSDAEKLAMVLDWESPIPHLENSEKRLRFGAVNGSASGLLLIGNIPNEHNNMIFHPLVVHREGLHVAWISFFDCCRVIVCPDLDKFTSRAMGLPERIWGLDADFSSWRVKEFYSSVGHLDSDVEKAYRIARQARFEHGEKPT